MILRQQKIRDVIAAMASAATPVTTAAGHLRPVSSSRSKPTKTKKVARLMTTLAHEQLMIATALKMEN